MISCKTFPAGIICDNFMSKKMCQKMIRGLLRSTWTHAFVARYKGSEYVKDEQDLSFSGALVTVDFAFKENEFNLKAYQNYLHQLILDRFDIRINKFSKYGISKYPVGSSLGIHSDTGVYNTERLITCILYLSAANEGGNLCFPEINFEIEIKTGMLVCFYSELKHFVTKITRGERIAMVMFAES